MLPLGFSADAVDGAPRRLLAPLHADNVRTVVALRYGACACALYLEPASPGQSTESVLRRRYFELGIDRLRVIAALDRHKTSAPAPQPPVAARQLLAHFVAEHARNAGASLYLRTCHPDGDVPTLADAPLTRSVTAVLNDPTHWLPEDRPTLVTR